MKELVWFVAKQLVNNPDAMKDSRSSFLLLISLPSFYSTRATKLFR